MFADRRRRDVHNLTSLVRLLGCVHHGGSVDIRGGLPEEIAHALHAGHDLITSAGCRELGITQDRLEGLMRRGCLMAMAKGVYADAKAVAGLGPWPRYALRSRAFVLASPPGTMAADWSAVAIHGLPTFSTPPAVPSVIRQGSRSSGSNRTRNGRTRFAAVPDRWLTQVDGTAVAHPAIAAVDLGRRCDPLAAMALADAAASRARSTGLLHDAWQDLRGWPFANRAKWFVDHSDPEVDSALETAGRMALMRAGLPMPRSNVWVGEYHPRYRLDHYWVEQRLAIEGDGMAKYFVDGDPAGALRLEKDRELWLQSKGIRVVRYGWKLAVGSPELLADRCRLMLDQQPGPVSGVLQWWPYRVGSEMRGFTA